MPRLPAPLNSFTRRPTVSPPAPPSPSKTLANSLGGSGRRCGGEGKDDGSPGGESNGGRPRWQWLDGYDVVNGCDREDVTTARRMGASGAIIRPFLWLLGMGMGREN